MNDDTRNPDQTLVAPREVQELLQRLTEASTEFLAVNSPRTLAGLAADTGIPVEKLRRALDEMRGRPKQRWGVAAIALFVLAVVVVAWPHPPAPQTAPVIQAVPDAGKADLSGLVGLDQVTFGPDSAQVRVDPSFVPTNPILPGISITSTIGPVMWGSGDHRAKAIHMPLRAEQATALKASIEELLRYSLERAESRQLPLDTSRLGGVQLVYDGAGYRIDVGIHSYNGVVNTMTKIPKASDKAAQGSLNRLIPLCAEQAVKSLQDQLTWMRKTQEDAAGR